MRNRRPPRAQRKQRVVINLPSETVTAMQKVLKKYHRIRSKSELAQVAIEYFCEAALRYGLDANFRPLGPLAGR